METHSITGIHAGQAQRRHIARWNYCFNSFVEVFSNYNFSGSIGLLPGSGIENGNTFDLSSGSDGNDHKKSSYEKLMQSVLARMSNQAMNDMTSLVQETSQFSNKSYPTSLQMSMILWLTLVKSRITSENWKKKSTPLTVKLWLKNDVDFQTRLKHRQIVRNFITALSICCFTLRYLI